MFFTAVNRYPTIELRFIGNNGGRKSSPQTKSQNTTLKKQDIMAVEREFMFME